MQITPHFGNLRFQSADSFNPRAANALSSGTDVPASTAPTTIAPVDAPASVQKPAFDVDALAKSILSFVQERLTKASEQGATKDELAALLAQARDGVSAGFDQAVSQLKDSGALDDSLSSGISAALQKIDSGLNDFAKQLGINDASTAPATPTDTQSSTPPTNSTTSLSQLAAAYKASFSSKQSVDLVVKTADGDTVHLQLGVKQKQSVSASYASDANGQQLAISSRDKSSGRLSISVDGNLDAGEVQALGDLLNQVGDLADSFFSGDISAALQQANTLDLSNPELSSLSLDLRSEVTSKSAIAAYSAVQSLGDDSTSSTPATTSATGPSDLASALTSLLPKASLAENSANLLKHLLAAQLGASDQQNNPLLDFVNRLLDVLGADTANETNASTPDSTATAVKTSA